MKEGNQKVKGDNTIRKMGERGQRTEYRKK